MEPWEKILCNQEFNRSDYRRTDKSFEQAVYETILTTCGFQAPQLKYKLEQTSMFTIEEMASSPTTLGFLQWVLGLMGARRVLEIGAFVGVSAMYFADALPEDGRVTTLEKFDHFAEIAKRNFVSNGLEHKIDLICGDASDLIPSLPADVEFDFVFIDGNKERYAEYIKLVDPLLRPGGVIAVDDAFFHGDALNDEFESEKGRGVRAALDLATTMTGWQKTLLPASNGMLFMTKPTG